MMVLYYMAKETHHTHRNDRLDKLVVEQSFD